MKIPSFKEFLFKYPKTISKIPEKWWHFSESLDTPAVLLKKEKGQHNSTLYYIKLNDKAYRIFAEAVKENNELYLHIGFERNQPKNGRDNWFMKGITNDLTAKEILSLFSTLKQVIIENNPHAAYMLSEDEPEKITRYYRMLMKMDLKNYNCSRTDDFTIVLCRKDSVLNRDINPNIFDNIINLFQYKNNKILK